MNAHVCPATDLAVPSALEHEARLLVSEQLQARVVHVDRKGGVDFCIEKEGAHHGILEVTRETDERWRAQEAQLQHQGWVFQTSLIGASWQVDLAKPSVPMKLDLEAIAQNLAVLEGAGSDHFPDLATGESAEVRHLADLGIVSGYRREEPGGLVYLGTPGITTWTGSDHLNDVVVRHEAANREKLSPGPGERHLFIWIELHALPVWVQITDGPLPDAPPLITEVDVVWVGATHQKGTSLWKADTSGWVRVTP